MNKFFIALMSVILLLAAGFATALDLSVTGVSTDPSYPPALNQLATIQVDVFLTNSTVSTATVLNVNFGNGQSVNTSMTLPPNKVFAFFYTVNYTSVGQYNVTATIDPSNLISEDNEGNNVVMKSINVIGSSTSLNMTAVNMPVNAGNTSSTNVNLVNTGSTALTDITLTASSLTSGSNSIPSSAIKISPSGLALVYVGSLIPITFTVNTPITEPAGNYVGTITIKYNGGLQTTVPITVAVTGAVYSITMPDVSLQGNPGNVVATTVPVTNNGTIALSGITFNPSALVSGSNTIPASAITLNPTTIASIIVGATSNVAVTVAIPNNQSTGTYTGTLAVSYNGKQLIIPMTVVVNSFVPAPSFTVSDVDFASVDQQRGVIVSGLVHLTNDGNQQLTLNLVSGMPVAYQATFSQSTITLASGSSVDVPVQIYLPKTQNSGRNEILGGIIVSATNAANLTRTARTYVTAASMLEITKIVVDDNGDTSSLSDGGSYTKAKAGDSVKLTVYVRNDFSSIDNTDINDINLDIRSSGSLDLDESDSVNDLQYGDKDQVSFSTTIPDDAEDGDSYTVTATVTGRDQNGASHTDTVSIRIEVKRQSHEILIKNIALSPQSVTICNGNTGKATLNVDLQNMGRNDENQVYLSIVNDDLGINQKFYSMSINKDDTLRKSYSFTVANNIAPGQYDILLTSFYDTNTESDNQVATLTVTSCQTNNQYNSNVQSGTNTNNNVQTQPKIPQVVPTNGATPVYGSASFTDSPIYLIILVAAVLVVLTVIIMLLVKFVF